MCLASSQGRFSSLSIKGEITIAIKKGLCNRPFVNKGLASPVNRQAGKLPYTIKIRQDQTKRAKTSVSVILIRVYQCSSVAFNRIITAWWRASLGTIGALSKGWL
jgi:hypothetical protein